MERQFFKLWSLGVNHSRLWHLGVRVFRPIFNRKAHDGVVSQIPGPMMGWFKKRDMPLMAEKTFGDRWKAAKRKPK